VTFDKRELWLLAAVLLLATVLRVGWPALTEFKFSEARLEALALELTRGGHLPLVGVPSSAGFDHSPISVYLYVPAFLFTANPVPATIYGGLVGVAAVGLCWWLARRWPGGGRWAALVAALLFAVSPWSVAFSRKIWQVAFVPLLTLAFVGLAVSALVEGQRWRLAWALVVYALLVQVHPSAVSLWPCCCG
jgi:predicted membrane-bound mannosyltransferase